jgi:flagellin
MTVINTNVKALFTQASLKINERGAMKAMQELSTGKRINSAKDDAAGLAIAARMTQQIEGLNQGIRNAGDAIAMIQTTEGATQNVTTMLLRISELAMQAANDTYSNVQRGFLNNEFTQLKQEINRMALTHEWNGFKIMAGKADGITDLDDNDILNNLVNDNGAPLNDAQTEAPSASPDPLELQFQVGDSQTQRITVELPNFTERGPVTRAVFFADFDKDDPMADCTIETDISTVLGAQTVIDLCKYALDKVSESRSMMGAVMNRLEHVVDNLTNVSTNSSASRSQIEDADYAKASTDLAKSQIMTQAATAVLAQANTSQQTVLKLLG